MSQIIQFLDSLGSSSGASHLTEAQYAQSVAALDATGAERQALLERDHLRLGRLLGGREKLICAIFSPSREEQPEDDGAGEPSPLQDGPIAQ
ncbi:MAG: hypothetical protein M3Q42_04540 [Pseudomonadota bacterium]|nr:hypothetical protein [Pseudomonadota bacterium]